MKKKNIAIFLILLVVAPALLGACSHAGDKTKSVSGAIGDLICPGRLSKAHEFLENDCSACHTPGKGIEASKCIVCHANNEALLKRQPTSFHANISTCNECHIEHLGRNRRPTLMSHAALANTGIKALKNNEDKESEEYQIGSKLAKWIEENNNSEKLQPTHSTLTTAEKTLNCATCHKNEDVHQGMLGADCVACHTTNKWTIADFKHPAPSSMDCSQCHQAPPSHYMMHFKMISQKVACKPNARVDQCFKCHLTTSWNDIKGVGWYKHH